MSCKETPVSKRQWAERSKRSNASNTGPLISFADNAGQNVIDAESDCAVSTDMFLQLAMDVAWTIARPFNSWTLGTALLTTILPAFSFCIFKAWMIRASQLS